MISVEQIFEIISQYKKHGWTLRRVLLSDDLRVRAYNELVALSTGEAVEFVSSDVEAAWFSRPSKEGEAWELRHLSTAPFALFEVFDADDEEETREEARKEMETRLKLSVIK